MNEFKQSLPLIALDAGRIPSVNDDSSAGFKTGALWSYSGSLYHLIDDTVGAAVWVKGSLTKKFEGFSITTGSFTLDCEGADFPIFYVRFDGTAADVSFSNTFNIVESTLFLRVDSATTLTLPSGSYSGGNTVTSQTFDAGYHRVTFGLLNGFYYWDFGLAASGTITDLSGIPTSTATASTPSFFDSSKNLISLTKELWGTFVQTFTNKNTPVDADTISYFDSASSFGGVKTTWTNVKAFLKTYFDTIYQAVLSIVSDAEMQAGTENTKYTTALRIASWWAWVKTQTQTFAAQINFTVPFRINSANGTNAILGANGNGVVAFTDNASAVNKIEVVNSITTNAVEVKANGSDTNIALKVSSKGSAIISFFTNAIERFKIGSAGELFASSLAGSGTRVTTADTSGNLSATLETYDPIVNQQWIAFSFSTFTENTIWGSDKGALTISNLILNRLGALFTFKHTYILVATSTAASTLVLKLKHGSTVLYTESISLTAFSGTTVNIATSGYFQTTSLGVTGVLKGFVHIIFGATSYFKYIDIASNLTADSILTETATVDTGTFTFTSNQGLTLNEA